MGKNKNKKGKGAEKTKEKEFKNAQKKLNKELLELGEEDVKNLLLKHENASKDIKTVTELKTSPPSPRCNMTLIAHPEKDFLIMFGGEYYNGRETTLYNDLYYYNIKNNEWSLITSPSSPAPRCSHQAVTFSHNGGEMWVFGGEYVSPSQSQYYHFNDLWVLSLNTKTWEKIVSPGGPSSRSGHRMVACRKMIFIFGGFRDNTVGYQYFNDVHAFSVDDRVWLKLSISGVPPSPRSGCVMAVTQDQMNVMVYGGYSKEKVKKGVDKGTTHSDMFMLSVDVRARTDSKSAWLTWKWSSIKQSGCVPLPLCSTSLVVTSTNRAVLFGGIRDENEEEDMVEGHCLSDMYYLEIDKGRWHSLQLKKPNIDAKKRRRREKNLDDLKLEDDDDKDMKTGDTKDDSSNESDEEVNKKSKLASTSQENKPGLFNFDLSSLNATNKIQQESLFEEKSEATSSEPFIPSGRMRPMMAAKKGDLYLYGGVREEGGKHLILCDLYSIDIQHMDQWKIIIPPNDTPMDWIDSSSEDEDDSEDGSSSSSEEEEEEDEEVNVDDPTSSGPRKKDKETFEEYHVRTAAVWLKKATKVAEIEKIEASESQMNKAAKKMAKEYWKKITF